jgi:hypothetical protein
MFCDNPEYAPDIDPEEDHVRNLCDHLSADDIRTLAYAQTILRTAGSTTEEVPSILEWCSLVVEMTPDLRT